MKPYEKGKSRNKTHSIDWSGHNQNAIAMPDEVQRWIEKKAMWKLNRRKDEDGSEQWAPNKIDKMEWKDEYGVRERESGNFRTKRLIGSVMDGFYKVCFDVITITIAI